MSENDKEYEVNPALEELAHLKLEYLYNKYSTHSRKLLKLPSYSDLTSYQLTKCITDFINLSGGIALSVNLTSRYRLLNGISDRETRLKLGDIIAVFDGKPMHIEVKKKNNYAKIKRNTIRLEAVKSGILYVNAHCFQDFYDWFIHEVNPKRSEDNHE